MKITKNDAPTSGFIPFTLEIEVETEVEAVALWAALNSTNSDLVKNCGEYQIMKKTLEEGDGQDTLFYLFQEVNDALRIRSLKV